MVGLIVASLMAVGLLVACGGGPLGLLPSGCLPGRLPSPETTTVDGREVFVVQPITPGSSAGASCYTFVQVGSLAYVDRTADGGMVLREASIDEATYAVGGPGSERIEEVRSLRGVPVEYVLAARVESGAWIALGGHPVEDTEMEAEPELAAVICDALEAPTSGWSFCQPSVDE